MITRKSTKENGIAFCLVSGQNLAVLQADLAKSFPGTDPRLVRLAISLDSGFIDVVPYIMVPEPEDDYQARVAHEARIERERAIAQADTDRQQRRMLYDKLKQEFEGGEP